MINVWAGKISPGCGPAGCSDCPNEREPLSVPCPTCDRCGCDECGGIGYFDLCECPRKYVGSEYWELLRYAGLFRKGIPPIQGGALDQESWFMGACEYLWAEQDRVVPPSVL